MYPVRTPFQAGAEVPAARTFLGGEPSAGLPRARFPLAMKRCAAAFAASAGGQHRQYLHRQRELVSGGRTRMALLSSDRLFCRGFRPGLECRLGHLHLLTGKNNWNCASGLALLAPELDRDQAQADQHRRGKPDRLALLLEHQEGNGHRDDHAGLAEGQHVTGLGDGLEDP